MSIYTHAAELDFACADLPALDLPDQILMADPADFESVDREEARRQWWCLREGLEDTGLEVEVLAPHEGFADLVFCASPCLAIPYGVTGRAPLALAASMIEGERGGEVPHVISFMRELGYQPGALKQRDTHFEGAGDGLWHPGRRLLWAGVGPRSSAAAWGEIARRFGVATILLELLDEDFDRLDSALCLIDEQTCLWFPGAFTEAGQAMVRALFPRAIEAPEEEARHGLACGALCPDGRHVLVQVGNDKTRSLLEKAGLKVVELDISEFMKTGGFVSAMALLHGPL